MVPSVLSVLFVYQLYCHSDWYKSLVYVLFLWQVTQCTFHSDVVNLYSLCLICMQNGVTAVHAAAYAGHSHVLSYLLKVPGALISARDKVTMSL